MARPRGRARSGLWRVAASLHVSRAVLCRVGRVSARPLPQQERQARPPRGHRLRHSTRRLPPHAEAGARPREVPAGFSPGCSSEAGGDFTRARRERLGPRTMTAVFPSVALAFGRFLPPLSSATSREDASPLCGCLLTLTAVVPCPRHVAPPCAHTTVSEPCPTSAIRVWRVPLKCARSRRAEVVSSLSFKTNYMTR